MNEPTLPDGILELGPEAADRVRALVRRAEQRQEEEADAALDHALAIVPRPLRSVVRKVLLG